MLLFVLIACLILIFSLSLHYNQHFRFELYCCTSNGTDGQNTDCNCSIFIPIDGESFDFFPSSFFFYILFIIFLCILIVIIDILNYHNNDESIIISYHNHSWHTFNLLYIILTFGIMILSLWHSLFVFYRYYKTISAKQLISKSTKQIIKKYIAYYVIIFVLLFSGQTLIYYWIFPILILFQTCFNFYCSLKFASVLIERYKLFIAMDERINNENEEILKSIYFMKNASCICCILQSIYLGAFISMHNIYIIYYLPMLWSISCIVSTTHFVRNRKFLQSKIAIFNLLCMCDNTQINDEHNVEGMENETLNDTPIDNSSYINSKDKATLNNALEEVLKTQSILEHDGMSPSANNIDDDQISITIKNYSEDQTNDGLNTPKDGWSNKAASSPNDLSISSFHVHKTVSSPILPILGLQEENIKNQIDLNRNRVMSVPFDDKKKHEKEASLQEQLSIDEALQSFNVLAKYGFCPRTSIITMQQREEQKILHIKRVSSVIVNGNNNDNKKHKPHKKQSM